MSYLGSLLGAYGAGQEQSTGKPAPATKSVNGSNGSRTPVKDAADRTSGVKRKANDLMRTESIKALKTLSSVDQKVSQGLDSTTRLETSRSQPADSERRVTQSIKDRPAQRQMPKQKPRPAPAPTPAAIPPAKGSFADIMARAKALQATKLGQGSKLTHKAVSQEGPKEKRRKELASKDGKAMASAGPSSRSGSEDPRKQKPSLKVAKGPSKVVPSKPKREPVEISYKGTMRPTPGQSTYRGTAAAKATQSHINDRYGRRGGRYDANDEEEEGYDDGYDSAASSDMEAGAWDIDEEEEFALRNARAEDAAAKREEDEHRRQKLLRKQGQDSSSARRRF